MKTSTNPALSALRHHVTGAIERGEAQAIAGIPYVPRQHTPGPWSLSDSFDRVERRVKHGDNPPLVWDIASGINSAHPDYLPRAEQIANARLIAAAPELLAAARLAVAWAEQVPAPYRDWPHVAAARAAIAKATGGAA